MAGTVTEIREIDVAITGDFTLNYDIAHDLSKLIASRINPEGSLIAWHDKRKNTCGPGEVCKTTPVVDVVELERYGKSHGGNVKITMDDGHYMFIYS